MAENLHFIKETLRNRARQLGFQAVGFCDAQVLERERDYLFERGAGPFEPEDLPPRTDPRLLLGSARTVMSVGMSYLHSDPPKPDGLVGRLSKYCRGLDYHNLMLDRLEEIAREIRECYGAESVAFVDTGPPLERAFAERSGIGRAGKNTNLIAPKLGSYLFLGVLVTELDLPPDEPAVYSICGRCRLCIDACPTQCLDEWKLDSERCLGYLNQKYDDIPLEHREAMGDWIFGCDICQDVCPHNRKAPEGLVPEFAPLDKPGAFPDLLSLVSMSEQEFETWFGPTAADWRGSEAIRRNALVALGNSGRDEALEVVEPFTRSENQVLAEHATWAVTKLLEDKKKHPNRAEDD